MQVRCPWRSRASATSTCSSSLLWAACFFKSAAWALSFGRTDLLKNDKSIKPLLNANRIILPAECKFKLSCLPAVPLRCKRSDSETCGFPCWFFFRH